MIRGFLLFFAALVLAGAIGFASGVYVGPAVDPGQFRATVDGGVVAISKSAVSVLEKLEITPAKVPPATAPMEGEAALPRKTARMHRFSLEIDAGSGQPQSDAGSGQPQSDAGAGGLPANDATPPDHQAQDVAEPGGLVTELQSGHSTPAINAEETVGSISPAPPVNRQSDKQARRPGNKPVAKLKPRPRPAHKPVARLRPKPMPVYTPVARLKPRPKPNVEPSRSQTLRATGEHPASIRRGR